MQHVKVFLDLIEKCGCEDAEFFRNQFQFDESILIESADNV